MEVVGQFNNSFIVCRLGDDLYILDQHACNEKYNYEQLMNDTRINGQRLIQSNWIRPSIVDPSRWNCRLTTDFMELVGLVMESGGVMVRPPKLAKLLASRACRMSVMVGDTLSYTKMVSVGNGEGVKGRL